MGVTKVAGAMEVELDLEAELVQEELLKMFQSGIASALAIPIKHVATLAVSDTLHHQPDQIVDAAHDAISNQTNQTNRRRLQVNQSKWYDVAYEVIVPGSMDPDVVMAKVTSITHPDTVEAQVFKSVLMGTPGVAQVWQVLSKIPAFKFEDEVAGVATSDPTLLDAEAETSTPWGLVVIIIFLVVLCVVVSVGVAIVFQRKRARAAKQGDLEGLRNAADHDSVVVRIPSNTLLAAEEGALKKANSDTSSFEI